MYLLYVSYISLPKRPGSWKSLTSLDIEGEPLSYLIWLLRSRLCSALSLICSARSPWRQHHHLILWFFLAPHPELSTSIIDTRIHLFACRGSNVQSSTFNVQQRQTCHSHLDWSLCSFSAKDTHAIHIFSRANVLNSTSLLSSAEKKNRGHSRRRSIFSL